MHRVHIAGLNSCIVLNNFHLSYNILRLNFFIVIFNVPTYNVAFFVKLEF